MTAEFDRGPDDCPTAQIRIHVNAELQLHGFDHMGGCSSVGVLHCARNATVAHSVLSVFTEGFTK